MNTKLILFLTSLAVTICVLAFVLIDRQNGMVIKDEGRIDTEKRLVVDEDASMKEPNTDEAGMSVDLRLIVLGDSASQFMLQDIDESKVDESLLNSFVDARPTDGYRFVEVNTDDLREEIRNTDVDGILELSILEDTPTRLVADEALEHSSGWQAGLGTWRGKIEGEDNSMVLFVASTDGTLNATINSPTLGRIEIERMKPSNVYLLWHMDSKHVVTID